MNWPFYPLRMWGYEAGMIDPPWPLELRNEETGNEKSPSAQYQCMTIEAIAALPVEHLFRQGAFIGLWCTNPLVAQGVHARILAAWKATPITMITWAKRTNSGKLRWGPGYVVRTVTEPLILASYGPHGVRGRNVPSLIDGVAREHSRKPDEIYRVFEAMTPNRFRADIFARETRPGWESWGNEATKFDGDAA